MESKEYLEYQMACTEVLEVLKYMPKKDVEKIPTNIIKSLKSAKRFDYKFRYDTQKKANEQKISKRAKAMIARLYRDYMVSEQVKKLIESKEKFDKKKANSNWQIKEKSIKCLCDIRLHKYFFVL